MPLWDVVGPRSWTRGPPLPGGEELPESYFDTISKILEDIFLKKVLNILDSLDCHFLHKAADTVYRVLTFFSHKIHFS